MPFHLPPLIFRLIGFKQIPITHLSYHYCRFLITVSFLISLINFGVVIW
jgi:hypothetical protein